MEEFWLSGKIDNVPAFLQPVAHSLLQTQREIRSLVYNLSDENLWLKPAERASVGFHLQHMKGVLSRMLTYAKGEKLSEKQLDQLSDEGLPFKDITVSGLLQQFNEEIWNAIDFLKKVNIKMLTDYRPVGRKKLPSTLIGLLFHAAEHLQRHLGQVIVTVSVLNYKEKI